MSSRKSEILHFDGFLLFKSYKVSAKTVQKSYLSWLKCDAKLKEKLTCGFKYDMWNLVNFHPTTQKSKNFFSMDSFCPKYARFELQKYRGVIFHNTEQRCKIWINLDLAVSKMLWGIWWTFIRALKSLKNWVSGQFPDRYFSNGHIPDGHFPDGHFPDGLFPGGHFPKDISPTRNIPSGKSSSGKCPLGMCSGLKFSDFRLLAWKLTKFLTSFFNPRSSFPLSFTFTWRTRLQGTLPRQTHPQRTLRRPVKYLK